MDETQPLLPDVPPEPIPSDLDKDIVTFDVDGDPENPEDWPNTYKWGIVALLAFMAFTVFVLTTLPCMTFPIPLPRLTLLSPRQGRSHVYRWSRSPTG